MLKTRKILELCILSKVILSVFVIQISTLPYVFDLDPNTLLRKSERPDSTQNYLWINQYLNHFDYLDGRTWMQRYSVSAEFYRQGGPGILYISGESGLMDIPSYHLASRIASQVSGKLFNLEHRYYGESRPTDDTTIENLRFLTCEQALRDIATFVANITMESRDNIKRWILIGGSYAGSLAIWAKMKYPHLVYGVIAASPPLKATPFFYDYVKSVNRSLLKYGSKDCYEAVWRASHQILAYMKTGIGRRFIRDVFNLCPGSNFSLKNIWLFNSIINNNIDNVVQFSRNNDHNQKPGKVYLTMEQMCNMMTSPSNVQEIRRLADLLKVKRNSTHCVDISFNNFIDYYSETIWDDKQSVGRAWFYQTCTEFGWFQTADMQPFQTTPPDFPGQLCSRIFNDEISSGSMKSGAAQTNIYFGGLESVKSLSRTVIFNGGVDPWHMISYSKPTINLTNCNFDIENCFTDPWRMNSIFVDDASHAEVMAHDSENDSNELRKARRAILKLVKEWIK